MLVVLHYILFLQYLAVTFLVITLQVILFGYAIAKADDIVSTHLDMLHLNSSVL